MIHLKKAFSILAVSFLVTLSSCDPSASSTSSQIYWNGVPLVFENAGDSHSWSFNLDSCESTFICTFDVYFSVSSSDSYMIYSTGSFDTSGTLFRYEEDDFITIKDDWNSGDRDNFKITGSLYSFNLYWLSIDARPNDDEGPFNFFSVYLEKNL
jgi:hypothetical protein